MQQNKTKSNKNTTELENKFDDNLIVENLLKLHNQKVMASRCKYDSNGRRIRNENTTVQPASSDMCSSKYSGIASESKATKQKLESYKEEMKMCVDGQQTNADFEKRCQSADIEGNQTIEEENETISELNSTYVCEDNVGIQNETGISTSLVNEKDIENLPSNSVDVKIWSRDESRDKDYKELKEESKELSIEELLKQHNKKVMASKCKYDSNGRRIQPANPMFCPAPCKVSEIIRTLHLFMLRTVLIVNWQEHITIHRLQYTSNIFQVYTSTFSTNQNTCNNLAIKIKLTQKNYLFICLFISV